MFVYNAASYAGFPLEGFLGLIFIVAMLGLAIAAIIMPLVVIGIYQRIGNMQEAIDQMN